MRTEEEEKKRRELQKQRIEYAIRRFNEEGIRFSGPDENGRFVVFNDVNTRRYQFYAGNGLILGPYEERGIENMVMIATKGRKQK